MVSGAPIGSTPFGFGTPVAAPLPPTQGPALSRFIDSYTGDYYIDPKVGQFGSMPSLRQRVLLIVNTEIGSSTALPDLGIVRPRKIDESYVASTRAAIRRACYRLTDIERIMKIQDILVDKQTGGRIAVTLIYSDLTGQTGLQIVTSVI